MKTLLLILFTILTIGTVFATEKVAVHSAKTGQVIVRDRTIAEQALIDIEQAKLVPVKELTIKTIIDALKAKGLLTEADIQAQIK